MSSPFTPGAIYWILMLVYSIRRINMKSEYYLFQSFTKIPGFCPADCWGSEKTQVSLLYYWNLCCWDGFWTVFLCFAVHFGGGNFLFIIGQQYVLLYSYEGCLISSFYHLSSLWFTARRNQAWCAIFSSLLSSAPVWKHDCLKLQLHQKFQDIFFCCLRDPKHQLCTLATLEGRMMKPLGLHCKRKA